MSARALMIARSLSGWRSEPNGPRITLVLSLVFAMIDAIVGKWTVDQSERRSPPVGE
jgi:hypothetical protein